MLKEKMKWCVWKYMDTGKKKLTKVPYNPLTQKTISVSDEGNFLNYDTVLPFLKDYDGLGIRVSKGLVAIDIDDCVINGQLNHLAKEIINHFQNTYIEFSPSSSGLRIFCQIDETFQYNTTQYKMNARPIEVYIGGYTNRFVTYTGNTLQDKPVTFENDGLTWLLDTYMKRHVASKIVNSKSQSYLSDTDVIEKSSRAKNGEKFKALWSGDISLCASHSEADLALCSILAFYCGKDVEQIDRLFRQSSLYREKWDEMRGGDTYGNLTIEKAITSLSSIYTPLPATEFNDELMRLKTEFNYPLGSTYTWNDIGSGKLFADFYKDILRYVPERKSWYVYSDGIWQKDTGNLQTMKNLMVLADLVHLCALDILDDDKRRVFQKYVSKWQSHSYRISVLKDAQVYYPISVTSFDNNPFLLNCLNGTYNLKTKKFYPHNSNDFLTKKVNAEYNPLINNPRWQTFIDEIMSEDKDKSHFLQKMFGYGISGDTKHECLIMLHGVTTRNGKSTLCESVLQTLGSYACTARSETIALKQHNTSAPNEDVARLAGVRFVNISEPPKGLVLNVAQVKTMTGNDTLNARFLHENSFDFKPQFKLYINTNHLPSVNDLTVFKSGRIWLIPFNKHFNHGMQDKTLKQQFSSNEMRSTILNWLIEGYDKLDKEGLTIPEVIKSATNQYEHDSDKMTLFLEDCVEIGNFEEKTADVYYKYKTWCLENGHYPENIKNFKQALSSRFTVIRKRPQSGGHKTTLVIGLKLHSEFL